MNALLTATKFSSQSLASMIIVALICTAVPFIFLGYYRAKTGAKLSSFFIGMAFYVLFAFGAEGLLNMILFNFFSLTDVFNRTSHPVWYALYGAVTAGVFEEIGKYVGLSRFMKNRPGKQNAFLFGVGHGGFETIAFGSSLFMGNIILAFMVNSLGIDNYLAKLNLSGEALADYKSAIEQLITISPVENAAAGIERILALFFQAALTVLIYVAITEKKRKYFLPVAIVLHILGYIPTYLTQVGVITSFALNICLSGTVIVLIVCYAYRIFQNISCTDL